MINKSELSINKKKSILKQYSVWIKPRLWYKKSKIKLTCFFREKAEEARILVDNVIKYCQVKAKQQGKPVTSFRLGKHLNIGVKLLYEY